MSSVVQNLLQRIVPELLPANDPENQEIFKAFTAEISRLLKDEFM